MTECEHKTRVDVETGEVVCTKCGVVTGTLPEDAPARQESRLSLHHNMELGGDPKDAKRLKPRIYAGDSRDLSDISNLCGRLNMPDPASREAWNIYKTLRSLGCRPRAACALYAAFVACRNHECGIPVERIRDAIPYALEVESVPPLSRVFFALGVAARESGIAVRRPTLYYINVAVSSAQDRFAHVEDFDLFKNLARVFYGRLSGDSRSRAKRAVAIALAEMGVPQ